jgi:hypothetical protein
MGNHRIRLFAMLALVGVFSAACGGQPKRQIDRDRIDQNADDTKRDMDGKQ